MSEASTWFREDDRTDRFGLAQVLAAQALVTARAAVDGSWVLPPPLAATPAATALPVCPPAPVIPNPAIPNPLGETIWIAPEQARRSLVRLVRAAAAGAEVVL